MRLTPPAENPLTGRSTLVAPARAARPADLGTRPRANACPFCPETRAKLAPPVDADECAGLFVVANRFPALIPPERSAEGVGAGRQEVVVESAAHDSPIQSRSRFEVVALVELWARRVTQLRSAGFASVIVTRNVGRLAGGSLSHPHSQVSAFSVVPPALQRLADREPEARRLLDRHLVRDELVVARTGCVATFVPTCPERDFETWIAPVASTGRFDQVSANERADFADQLSAAVRRLSRLGLAEDYHTIVYDRLDPEAAGRPGCWLARVVPRGSPATALDGASGFDILSLDPSEVAETLRITV